MREPLERDLGGDRDRRGVQGLGDLGADEAWRRRSPRARVDDDPRRPGRVAAEEAGAGVGGGLDVDRPRLDPLLLGRLQGQADRGQLGLGEHDPRRARTCRRVAATSLPAITSAQIRAWYLPMWVSSERPLTSPIA